MKNKTFRSLFFILVIREADARTSLLVRTDDEASKNLKFILDFSSEEERSDLASAKSRDQSTTICAIIIVF